LLLEGPIGFPRTIPRPPGPKFPPCLAPQAPFRKFQGFVALAIVLRTVLESGVPLWLAVPNAMAESLGLAGPPDVGDVPVEAPGPGCFQHRALAGAQATSQLQLVLHIRTFIINT
jgi:hypothetical protein